MGLLDRAALCTLLSLAGCSGGAFEIGTAAPDAADSGSLDTSAPDATDAADAADTSGPDATDATDAHDAADTSAPDATDARDATGTPDAADAADGGGGTSCTYGAPSLCGVNAYCDAAGCGAGKCKARTTTELSTRAPVCGCDGVTYWNASIASSHGMAVAASGPCAAPKFCGGFGGTDCPAGSVCNFRQADKNGCGVADAGGSCWALPVVCPAIVIGPQSRSCNTNSGCVDECNMIKQGTAWFQDTSCPT